MASSNCLPTAISPVTTSSSPTQRSAPVPSSFVKRNGTRLVLDGVDYKAVGPNVYWLGLDENVIPSPSYPSRSRVLEIMSIASAMGANTIRSTTLGISYGTPLSVESSLGVYNQEAFASIDWAIWAAKSYGIRLILPLTDQYDYYHGGIPTFFRFRNLTANSPANYGPFYDLTSEVYSDFRKYVGALINHRSNITGLTMAEEPTILAFETGNELGGYDLNSFPPPVVWTTAIASYLKEIAPNTLVMSGSYGVRTEELGIAEVDIYSDHYYPPYASRLSSSAHLASSHNKAFLVGEFDWTNKYYQPLVYLAVIIPALFAASVWIMPRRWWPWRVSLGCCSRKRRRGKREEIYSMVGSQGITTSDQKIQTSIEDTSQSICPPSPSALLPSPSPSSPTPLSSRGFLIQRYQFSLFLLLFSPILAGIIYAYLPSPLSHFLSTIESLSSSSQLSGSFYWSLFGRDNNCCQYVQHGDGFTLHYPTNPQVQDAGTEGRVLELIAHAWNMRGVVPGWLGQGGFRTLGVGGLPSIACPQMPLSVPSNSSWIGGIGNSTR